MTLKLLFIAAIILTSLHSYCQTGSHVYKDADIKRFESKIIKFLVDEQAFGGKYSRPKEIEGVIYIHRRLKLHQPDVMLVSFGALADHSWQYWGILDKKDAFLFHYSSDGKDSHSYLLNYLNKYDANIRQVILNYLQTNVQEDHIDEPN